MCSLDCSYWQNSKLCSLDCSYWQNSELCSLDCSYWQNSKLCSLDTSLTDISQNYVPYNSSYGHFSEFCL
ncbi:hypothetical protein BUY94_00060 [Mammaliicoccus fleurettii]|nr:hypothetical protein BUY94_00060 [Mammaliicoccus fleurettii]